MNTNQQRVVSEGKTLGEAIRNAAEQLSVTPDCVGHEIDKAHFLSPTGRSQGAHTVKIFAWAQEPKDTSGADAAREWLSGLIAKMGFEAEISVRMKDDKVADLAIKSPHGRYLVGRRGATLHAIQDLLVASVPAASEGWRFRIDVLGGDRDRDRRDGGDGERRGRRDRRDRGGDGDRRGRRDDRRGRRDDRRRNSDDVDALRRLARKLGRRVQETGKSLVIRQELNSFERRIVHMTIGDIDGLETESIIQDGTKRVKIMAAGGEE